MDKMREALEFEKHEELASHIARMANSGHVGSTVEWSDFIECLNAALAQQGEQEPVGKVTANHAPAFIWDEAERKSWACGWNQCLRDKLSQPATIPEGWVEAIQVLKDNVRHPAGVHFGGLDDTSDVRDALSVLIAAAPEQPAAGQVCCDFCGEPLEYGDEDNHECGSSLEQPTAPAEQWIPCSERLPTEADADPKGRALFEFGGDVTHAKIAFICGIGKDYPGAQWKPTGLVRPEPPEVK